MSVSSGNGTASLSDLKDGKQLALKTYPCVLRMQSTWCWPVVLKDTLEARGSLNQIKARIRAEIFAALDDQVVCSLALHNLKCSNGQLM